jgi:hypothetical protein
MMGTEIDMGFLRLWTVGLLLSSEVSSGSQIGTVTQVTSGRF